MEVFKGCCLKHQNRPILHFSRIFFTPLRYDYPFDETLVLWQYESRIRGLMYCASKNFFNFFHFRFVVSSYLLTDFVI